MLMAPVIVGGELQKTLFCQQQKLRRVVVFMVNLPLSNPKHFMF